MGRVGCESVRKEVGREEEGEAGRGRGRGREGEGEGGDKCERLLWWVVGVVETAYKLKCSLRFGISY